MAANESIVGNILNYMGMSGTAVPTGGIVPRLANQQSQELLSREFQEFGEVQNPDAWVRFTSMTNRPTSFTAMLELWEQMSLWDLLAAALVQIVDEATQSDSTSPEGRTIWYESDNPEVEEDLNNMLTDMAAEELLPSQLWYLAALGNNFEKVEYSRGTGVTGLTFIHPTRVRRYWLKRNREVIGYHWFDGAPPDKEDIFKQGNTEVARQIIGSGSDATARLWYPWDFMHMRRMYRMRESEHGEPIFEEAQGIYKKLRMALDQMSVTRAQVQPDRYVINVDVKQQPPVEQMRTVQRWRQMLRSKLAYGTSETSVDDFKAFYNALALDSILYIARPEGYQHSIEKLPGTANIPDIYDVEMLTNLFFSVIGMPKEWLGGTQGEGGPTSGRALLAQDIRFLRKVKALRRPLIQGYTWLAYFHLVLKGKDVRNLTVEARMPDIGSLEDQLKLETLKLQAEVLTTVGDAIEKFQLNPKPWVEVIFSRYMHLPDDLVNTILTELPPDLNQTGESKKRADNATTGTTQMLRELERTIGNNPRAGLLIRSLRETVNGKKPRNLVRMDESKVFRAGVPQQNDIIISSFGKDPTKGGEVASARTGWRRYNFGAHS